MSKQLGGIGLNYEFVKAVDGRKIGAENIVKRYGLQVFRIIKINEQIMTLGAVGCLLSHLKLYERIVGEGIDVCCILEDDAIVQRGFYHIITSPRVHNSDWDVLLLGHYSMYRQCFHRGAEALYWRRWIHGRYCVATPAEFPFTTLGYIIRKKAAERLLDYAFPLRMPADWVLANAEFIGLRLLIVTPPCVHPHPLYRKRSTVRDFSDSSYGDLLKKYHPFISEMSKQSVIFRHIELREADLFLRRRKAQMTDKPQPEDRAKGQPRPRSRQRETISVFLRKLGYARNAYTRPA